MSTSRFTSRTPSVQTHAGTMCAASVSMSSYVHQTCWFRRPWFSGVFHALWLWHSVHLQLFRVPWPLMREIWWRHLLRAEDSWVHFCVYICFLCLFLVSLFYVLVLPYSNVIGFVLYNLILLLSYWSFLFSNVRQKGGGFGWVRRWEGFGRSRERGNHNKD